MKKTEVKQRFLNRLMKMTLYQFGLVLVFSHVTMANNFKKEDKLGAKVTFDLNSTKKAEQQTISGTVVDEKGMPIPGVSILVKGTKTAVLTEFDGRFTIAASESDVLVFSFIGFATQEVAVSGQKIVNITLKEDIAKLDEVVVVAYGTQKRSEITGAVSQIEAKDIAKNPTANISNALVGQTAGVIATQPSGEPGYDGSQIFIRGIGTFGGTQPLFVIDGIVRSDRDFAQLNANEIESLSILKDAASAAVFGVRGANGVILVTTKRGKEGKMQIDFSTSHSIQERTREPEFLDSYEFANLYNEALINDGKSPFYTQEDLDKYRDGSSPDTHPNVSWMNLLKNTASMHRYDLAASGGTEKLRYATSLGYLTQDGIVPTNRFQKYTFRSNIDANVTNTTVLSFDITGRDEETNNLWPSGDLFRWAVSTPPNKYPLRYSNGGYSEGPGYLAEPANGYRNRRFQTFKGRIQLEQKIPFIDGLSIKGIASYDKSFEDQRNWYFPIVPFYERNPDGTFNEKRGTTELYNDHNDYQSITLESHLNYKKSFGEHDISALVLYTETKDSWRFLSGFRTNYELPIDEIFAGSTEGQLLNGYSGGRGRQGVVGRINWTFADKYTIEGSFRTDASEQFAPDQRWGIFPSGSFAYLISNENFMKNFTPLDALKLKASYGVLGNDAIGGRPFLYLTQYIPNFSAAIFGDNQLSTGINEGALANPNVTWETVKKFNVGFESSFWRGKLSLNVDYFYDKRDDVLWRRGLSVSDIVGVELPAENLVKVQNQGIEVTLGHKNYINEDLKYSMSANMTYAKNKLLYIDEPAARPDYQSWIGLPLGSAFGLKAVGIFQTQEEVDAAPFHSETTAPGDLQYLDVNGDGEINGFDAVHIGRSAVPEIIFGYTANVQYKDFELSVLLQGATNVNQYLGGEAVHAFYGGASAYKHNLDRWTPNNPDATEPKVSTVPFNLNQTGSSWWVEDGSYLRIKNVELAYNVPVKKFAGNFIQGIRVYVNGANLATWSDIKDWDPETGNGRGWGYPQFRIWNAGINFKF